MSKITFYIDKLAELIDKHNNKPASVSLLTYTDFDAKNKVVDPVRILNFNHKEAFVIKKVQNTVPWALISAEKHFIKKNCKRQNEI